jgi:acyl carrier protein
MKESDFLRGLEEIMEVDTDSLTPEATLADLEQWNSLSVVSFIAFADEHAGLTLNARSIQGCTSVRDLMSLLGQAISAS